MKVTILPPGEMSTDSEVRSRNLALAAVNRQAVFQGDCARCHAGPASEQMGEALYVTACAICHDAEHRAAMVPDFRAPPEVRTRDIWLKLIVHGKPGTLMPAFSREEGAPLTRSQIDSLVDYLATAFLQHPSATPLKASPENKR
jgi:mono/diheme cytochrome c family protein